MAEEGKRDAPIPAPGDGAGRAEGGAAPGSRRRETASGRSEGHAAASKMKMEADLSAMPFLWPPSTRPSLLPQKDWEEAAQELGWDLIPSELKDAVEEAMKYLRRVLKGAELQEYEGYYEGYKKASDHYAICDNAYRILSRFIGSFGRLSLKDEKSVAGLVGGAVRLLSIHVDYIFDFERLALIRRTQSSEAVIKDKLSVGLAYEYVVEDVQNIARHISERAGRLSALTKAFLKALLEMEGAARYPEALEQEKPREGKSEGKEAG
jgi:hypothetical protein